MKEFSLFEPMFFLRVKSSDIVFNNCLQIYRCDVLAIMVVLRVSHLSHHLLTPPDLVDSRRCLRVNFLPQVPKHVSKITDDCKSVSHSLS